MLAGGAVDGRVRSAAYGYTVRRTLASAYLPAGLAQGTPLEIEVLGRPVTAEIAADVLYDPGNERVRA